MIIAKKVISISGCGWPLEIQLNLYTHSKKGSSFHNVPWHCCPMLICISDNEESNSMTVDIQQYTVPECSPDWLTYFFAISLAGRHHMFMGWHCPTMLFWLADLLHCYLVGWKTSRVHSWHTLSHNATLNDICFLSCHWLEKTMYQYWHNYLVFHW